MPQDNHYPVTITVPRILAEALIDVLKAATERPVNDPRMDVLITRVRSLDEKIDALLRTKK